MPQIVQIDIGDYKKQKGFRSVKWVPDEFRTNTLSTTAGGVDVLVTYKNRTEITRGYDKIKDPYAYVSAILFSDYQTNHDVSFQQFSKFLPSLKMSILKETFLSVSVEMDKTIFNVYDQSKDSEMNWGLFQQRLNSFKVNV